MTDRNAGANEGLGIYSVKRVNPAVVIVPCASRKRIGPQDLARAASLERAAQAQVEEQWLARLDTLPRQATARRLYGGRGFSLAAGVAEEAGARLLVISAGLGLVEADRDVPSYGLTVSAQGEDAVGARVLGGFDAQRWWRAVKTSRYSSDWPSVFRVGGGPVLMALTRPYAEMVADDLAALADADLQRLRIFGHALDRFLPERVQAYVMPYDERLDAILAGTRTDFPQRALCHFAGAIGPSADVSADRAAVGAALKGRRAPIRVQRPRLDDAAMVDAIARHLRTQKKGIGRILRTLRHEDRIACEQGRFSRLYRVAERRVDGS